MTAIDSALEPRLPHDIFQSVLTRYQWAWRTNETWQVSFCLDSSRPDSPRRTFTADHLALMRLQQVSKDWKETLDPLIAQLDANLPLAQRPPDFHSTFELHPFFYSDDAQHLFAWAAHGRQGRGGHRRPSNDALAALPYLRDDISSPPSQSFKFTCAFVNVLCATNGEIRVSEVIERIGRIDLRAATLKNPPQVLAHRPWPAVRQQVEKRPTGRRPGHTVVYG